MSAYSQVQQAEFRMEEEAGYSAVKHQKFVGTGYFDEVAQTISAGQSSTTALAGSTEAEQFTEPLVAALPEEAPQVPQAPHAPSPAAAGEAQRTAPPPRARP